ncbi:MAG: IS21-like element helper ATPase IstB [Methyloprofundus sp.]|nr:IS21-like element helper ATPase IstB [Methyloprofundus sp.]
MGEIVKRELNRAQENESSYSEFLSRLLREEYQYRCEQSLRYRLKMASLPERLVLETFPFELQTGVRQAQIKQLAELDFIPRAENIVFIGNTAMGKTGLAIGILIKAIENGYQGKFVKAQDLFDHMYNTLADRSSRQLIDKLMRVDLLVIDELGYLNIRSEQSNMFFKLMDERYRRKSTIITTNLDYEEWHGFLGQKAMVDALLSRLRHYCTTIRINGPGLRPASDE